MSDADEDQRQQTADAAAAAAALSSSSRPRRSAAAHAQLKLLQQAFESERPPVSSQTAPANGQSTDAAAAALAAPTTEPAAAAAAPAATAAAASEAPRRRGRPPKQKGAHTASTTAASAKRAVTGKRVRFTHSSSSESEAEGEESAEADQHGRKARGGSHGGRARTSTAKPPPRKKARGERQTEAQRDQDEEEEEDEQDRDAARSARRPRGRRGRGAAAAMQSDEEADDGSDEDGRSSSDSSESEQSEEEEEEEEDAEMKEERSEKEEEEEEEESAESSDPEEEEEEDEADAWLPGAESVRSMAAAKRSARRKAAKAKADAKTKPKSAASKPAAVDAAASASPKGPATAPSLMDLLDIDDEKAHVDVMRLALESDCDQSLAALLCSRSSKDGSTFLQRFYRVHCAFHTPGFADHRPRLLRLIELHGTFHASARNDAGQTLLHTICSPATYLRIYLRKRHSRHYPGLPDSWSTSHNSASAFTDGLLELLIRRGADFQQPDEKGAIPMLQLIKSASEGLVNVSSIVEDLLFPPDKVKAKYKGGARLQPFDLALTDRFDSTVLSLLCNKWKAQGKVWTIAHMLKRRASDLKDADLFANDTSGHCVLSLLAHAASQLKQPPPQHSWEIRANEQREKLPQQLLQAWQTARSPALRKELDVWMIPVLAEICCEYLMGPTQKEGVEMSKKEQRRVFGVRLAEQAQTDTDLRVKREDDSDAESDGQASAKISAAVKSSISHTKVIASCFRHAARSLLIRARHSSAESATPTAAAEGDGNGEQLDEDGDGDEIDGAKVEVMMASDEENAEPAEAAAPAAEEDDGPTDMEF